MKWISLILIGLAAIACGTEAAPDTAVITQLSKTGAVDAAPIASPDGTKLAFWRQGERGSDLWVADADLRNARALGVYLFFSPVPPVWSSDGRLLAAASSARSLADVAVVAVATDSVYYLTDAPAYEEPLQFLPDGDRVGFFALASGGTMSTFTVSRQTGTKAAMLPGLDDPAAAFLSPDGAHVAYTMLRGNGYFIWMSNSVGKDRRQITTDGYDAFAGPGSFPWSPDGREILYVSTRTGKGDIWVASIDGTTRQLTTDVNDDKNPAWSPNGKAVAFVSDRGRQTDVWVVPATGGEAIRVTDDAAEEAYPTWVNDSTVVYSSSQSRGTFWRRAVDNTVESRVLPDSVDVGASWVSPDRQWIAFQVDRPGSSNDLALMRPDGSDFRLLSRNSTHSDVRWNPSSTKLAWASDQSGSPDVYTASVVGDAAPVQLENWVGVETPAYWSDDGKSVVIVATRGSRLGDLWSIPLGQGDTTQLSHLGSVLRGASFNVGGHQHTLVTVAEQASGEVSLAEWLPEDSLRTIVSGNPESWSSPVSGLLGVTVVNDGRAELQVLRSDGSVIGSVGDGFALDASVDDRRLLLELRTGGQSDLALFDVATGKVARLTDTPEYEKSGMFTAAGDSIVFRRGEFTSVVMRADLGRLLKRR